MVDSSGISNKTIYELSAQEQTSILEMERAPCQGNAGGTFYFLKNLDHDVKSLSPATKHSQVFIAKQDAIWTRLTVVYVSCLKGAPAPKTYNGVYNDVLMQQNDSKEKTKCTAISLPARKIHCGNEKQIEMLLYYGSLRVEK